MNTTIEFCIFELVYVPNFSLKWQFWFFNPSLTHFSLKLFLTKFDRKGYFRSKTEKSHLCRHLSMVITYYIKLYRTGTDRHNGILKSLLLVIAETIIKRHRSMIKQGKHGEYFSFCTKLVRRTPATFEKNIRIVEYNTANIVCF